MSRAGGRESPPLKNLRLADARAVYRSLAVPPRVTLNAFSPRRSVASFLVDAADWGPSQVFAEFWASIGMCGRLQERSVDGESQRIIRLSLGTRSHIYSIDQV